MDRVTLPTGKTYNAAWAADVIGEPKWSALIPDKPLPEIVVDFDGVSPIIVDNELTGRHVYEGYTLIEAVYSREDGVQIVLRKGVK